ncbi:DUF4296 domain-containing protein [Leeuwenhoekiella marinoflava]|uniref:DUF4296 domain-containing protein n=2 Tax=Leeuwenhoekiella marinoflava TaxID=988 RepID=A0A4Q0PRP2_9FLAO|nr:DUF4296 domain-containing protein [Leeuwenhoekiella marinoflava]RXG33257.1 putative protein DUF4296 [Leeuwenhoekiella marinoflava]SHE44668.1 protein of unknown function [Leeuwenhoekiella marinoflava DSM 3653]
MIQKVVLALFGLIFILSCNEVKTPKKPDNFIKKDKMTAILYDISLMRALKTYSVNDMLVLGLQPDSYIYKKYDIDSLQLAESIDYYSVNFNEYTAMWEEVGERLTAQRDALQFKQNELDSIRLEKSNRRRDSIKKVNMVKPDSKDIQVKNDSLLESVSS